MTALKLTAVQNADPWAFRRAGWILHRSNREASASKRAGLDTLWRARGPSKLQGTQHLRHGVVPATWSPSLGRLGSSLRARAMLVSGPIATSKSSPGAALAASTSLRGAKPAGQRHQMSGQGHQMSGQRQPGQLHALYVAGLAPASSSAGQTWKACPTHRMCQAHTSLYATGLAGSSSDQMQNMCTAGRRRCGHYMAKVALASSSSGHMPNPGHKFVWGS